MPFTVDPFLDQFTKLFIMLVGATLLAGGLWRLNYNRKRRKRQEAWLEGSSIGEKT